jgi:phosphatidyl-myo-inositol dimannoside synthase
MISQPPHGIILMTYEYHPFPGGIGTYAGRLVDIVRAGGHAATVIAPAYPDLPAVPQEPDTHRILRHHQISPFGALRRFLFCATFLRTGCFWPPTYAVYL